MPIFGDPQKAAEDMQRALEEAQSNIADYLSQATGYMQPYYQAGTAAIDPYTAALQQMADPTAYYNQLMGGYTTSPAAQQQMEYMTRAANAAAAAGGYLGTPAEQADIMRQGQNIISADQQQWFNNLMGINQAYLGGEKGLVDLGQRTAQQMGQWTTGAGQDIASLAAQIGQAQAYGDVAGSPWANALMSAVGAGAGAYFGTRNNPYYGRS